MARTPLQLLDGTVLTAFSVSNTFSCSISTNSSGSLLFKSGVSHLFNSNTGTQWASVAAQSSFSTTASSSTYGLDILSSGSLASNLIFRMGITGLTDGFIMKQNASSSVIYSFLEGNVGINSTTFAEKLDIGGGLCFSTDTAFVTNDTLGTIRKQSVHGLVLKGATGSSNDFVIATPGGQLMYIIPTGTTNSVLNSVVGNVGIGTSSLTELFTLPLVKNMTLGDWSFLGNTYSQGGTILGFNAKADTTGAVSDQVIVAQTTAVGYQFIRMSNTGGMQFHTITGSVTAGNVASSQRMSISTAGVVNISGLTASQFVLTDASKNLVSSASLPTSALANPTASVGLTVVNGSATTAMRSDGAPALDQSIVPTWTGLHTHKITDAITSAISVLSVLAHNSSGTPAAGFGSQISFKLESSTTVDRDAAELNVTWTTATDATRASKMGFSVVTGAGSPTEYLSLTPSLLNVTGTVNVSSGFQIGGTATSGNVLRGNGTSFVSAILAMSDISGTVGIGQGGTANTSYSTNGVIYYNGSIFTSTSNLIWNGSNLQIGAGVQFTSSGIVTSGGFSLFYGAAGITSVDCLVSSGGLYSTYLNANGQTIVTARHNGSVLSFGVFGSVSAQASAYTGLGATSKTIASSVSTTASTNSSPYGYTTAAQADAIVSSINALILNMCAIISDVRGFGFIS